MRFLDTNIIIRYITRDDEEKAAASYSLLQRLENNEEVAITSSIVISEAVYVLRSKPYGANKEDVRDWLMPIIELPGLRLQNKPIYARVFDLYCSMNISFGDAFNAAYMEAEDVTEIYTYDTDFNKISGLKRVEPKA